MDSSEDQVSGADSELKSGRKSKDDSSGFACFIIMVLIIVIIVQLWLFSLLYIQLKYRKDGEKKTDEKENIFVLPSEYRLPRNVVPSSYELVIKIYLPFYVDFPKEKNLTVDGEVRINMLVRESTNVIVLNQAGISIEKEKCSVFSHDNAFVVERLDYDHTHERVSFYLNDVLPSGQTATLKKCLLRQSVFAHVQSPKSAPTILERIGWLRSILVAHSDSTFTLFYKNWLKLPTELCRSDVHAIMLNSPLPSPKAQGWTVWINALDNFQMVVIVIM
ncbi:unnamed protein product [Cylicocyclus nassatus]|uniref:Uncharacterized protein n=1 Tax=Cylicocyclus nassatus TaxID=53992 RepID=A0AA36MC17_CYLNA|nr:unnamed protein product [Cylicocyclus nassatus]